MTETGASFNRPYKPFGMNVKVPEIGERTMKLDEGNITGIVGAPVEPIFNFLEENEKVFNGDITTSQSVRQCVWKMKKQTECLRSLTCIFKQELLPTLT